MPHTIASALSFGVKKWSAALLLCAASLALACAANAPGPQKDKRGVWVYPIFVFEGKKGDWTQARNWRKGELPTGELPRVNVLGGRTVTLATPVENPLSLLVMGGDQGPAPSELFLKPGARLNVGGIWMPNVQGANSMANLQMDGGALTVGNLPGHSYFFDVGFGATTSGTARFAIRAGTLQVNYGLRVGSTAPGTNTGIFAVQGSQPVITLDAPGATAFQIERFGTLDFILDETGVSTIDSRKSRFTLQEGATIRVDGKAYQGGTQNIVLIQAKELVQAGAPALQTVNFAADYTAQIVLEPKRAILRITQSAR